MNYLVESNIIRESLKVEDQGRKRNSGNDVRAEARLERCDSAVFEDRGRWH